MMINILIIIALILFEIIISIDNAIINANILSTMSEKAKRWFLTWGIFISVFLVRGILPWIILWVITPNISFLDTFFIIFSSDTDVKSSIDQATPYLMIGGGIFLTFLFLHWLFLEEKKIAFPFEKFFLSQGAWFFAITSIILVFIVWKCLEIEPYLALSATIGSSAFFITHGFKQYAEEAEKKLLEQSKKTKIVDISKILYLEVIDATFSIDGVIGAFAFTTSVVLILIGNGIGAIILRQITISNIKNIKKYVYLKNGAMYSVFLLGISMLLEGFNFHIPKWISPISTILIIGYFTIKSYIYARNANVES